MLDDKLRIGIIGVGLRALSLTPALRASGRAEVVAICRRNPQRLAMAQKTLGVSDTYTSWQEMLDQAELDAAVVTTPHYLHAEPAMAALERGLHVSYGPGCMGNGSGGEAGRSRTDGVPQSTIPRHLADGQEEPE